MHTRQTSKKVKAALHTKFANGLHIGAYAPIGYMRDPEQKDHLLIDSDARWIVEKIFDLAVHGMGAANSIRRYGECMLDCRVVEMLTLDHGLGGEEHKEAVREVVNFLREA